MSEATGPTSVNRRQAAHFDALAEEWWTPTKGFRQLNRESTLRQDYIREVVLAHLDVPDGTEERPLTGLSVADVGCGGGYVAEPLARWGARVVGVDVAPSNIAAASRHATETGLDIDYRVAAAEELAAAGERFDVVVSLEVAEHVADVPVFLRSCGELVRPGGLLVVSTINRTVRSALTVIFAAEYVLRWIPRGTHHYRMFVTPAEVDAVAGESGLTPVDRTGVKFDVRTKSWRRVTSEAGSYIGAYRRA
ncbi:bifunctional 2-polyprenyl-6-hydroxyphenol methylase/3-demethylubiquinol 3-O-methyltransferase UbiG [Actinomadura sp. DC4]|uniref:bifunctional 2-polyprenyl-6-hydroxyphenol methylase/3-demethylubiquinol 3-O-methyltransferase UbiG n=1 Tax=Actinomadura sp. DC4 TaxID=3055069 RepID=UPI0025AFF7A2|nr:bifunctional 2-polyprenyl-6-hydroxyphenol methylase/3-demethylubiquinol 3-O-methyltransferase UbiG [Actinomadura sp. DC4]MDN3355649.1 bifunctional 2-polyprenyl-6-hydroxyphenol methylase/3-demethylubiquinol 3-O-methyltransferase UbiG [Actinomadura sp. DC4]